MDACRKGFFLPVNVLGRLFRGKYLAELKHLFDRGEVGLPPTLKALANPQAFQRWLSARYRKEWVVYAKRPFGGPAQVLKYLARYTHRVAISNSRLLDVSDGMVTFGYKDYAADGESKVMKLPADEFLRRFTQHVLPKGFVKIRHCGLLANRFRGGTAVPVSSLAAGGDGRGAGRRRRERGRGAGAAAVLSVVRRGAESCAGRWRRPSRPRRRPLLPAGDTS